MYLLYCGFVLCIKVLVVVVTCSSKRYIHNDIYTYRHAIVRQCEHSVDSVRVSQFKTGRAEDWP